VPCCIPEGDVSQANRSTLSTKKEFVATKTASDFTTIISVRGHVLELAPLLGKVFVEGVEKAFLGDKPHMTGGSGKREWNPTVDGGASEELVAFLLVALDVQAVERSRGGGGLPPGPRAGRSFAEGAQGCFKRVAASCRTLSHLGALKRLRKLGIARGNAASGR